MKNHSVYFARVKNFQETFVNAVPLAPSALALRALAPRAHGTLLTCGS